MNFANLFRRSLQAVALIGGLLLLPACLSLSVHPLYDDDTLTYEPGLVGVWGGQDAAEGDSWEFQPAGPNEYRLIIRETGELRIDPERDGLFTAHLVRLGDALYLDLFPEEPETGSDFFKSHIVPAHSFWSVRLEGNVLVLGLLDNTYIEKGIEDGSLAIDHVERDGIIVFTAPTSELQKLIGQHPGPLFTDEETLQRIQ